MDQQTELTPVLRITAGIEMIQRGINDMDRAGVAAQALSEIDQCLARLRSAFDDLPNQSSRTRKRAAMGAASTCAMCSSLLLVMARIQRCLPGAMCRLQLTAQPLRRAGLETREMIWTDTKSLS